MATSFQRSFQHLLAANSTLRGPPPLQPAPTVPLQLPTLQPAPATLHHPRPTSSPPLPVLQPALPPQASTNTRIEFIDSVRGKPKLIHDGYIYTFHQTRTNGNVAWWCDLNNKGSRVKGISCNATAVTTGTSSTSTLEYAKQHSHLPNVGRVGTFKVRNTVKDAASQDPTAKPHSIVAGALNSLPADVHLNLPGN